MPRPPSPAEIALWVVLILALLVALWLILRLLP